MQMVFLSWELRTTLGSIGSKTCKPMAEKFFLPLVFKKGAAVIWI